MWCSLTLKNKVGTLMMFAVRSIFARPEQLAATMQDLAAKGLVPAELTAEVISRWISWCIRMGQVR